MKSIKLLNTLPTIFGLIAITGALVSSQSNMFGFIMLYGGGLVALVVGLLSVISAMRRHKLGGIGILNIAWVILVFLFFAWGVFVSLTWNRFLGS